MLEPVTSLDDLRLLAALSPIEATVERARAQKRPEPRPPLLRVGRRDEHGVDAGGEGFHAVLTQIVEGVQEDRHEVGPNVGLQAAGELDPARGRDPVIEQDTSGGWSSASSKAASASNAVRTAMSCARRKATRGRVAVRLGATMSPSTWLGNGSSLLFVVLSSGSIASEPTAS